MNEALYRTIKDRAELDHRSIHSEILVVLERFFGRETRENAEGAYTRKEQ